MRVLWVVVCKQASGAAALAPPAGGKAVPAADMGEVMDLNTEEVDEPDAF